MEGRGIVVSPRMAGARHKAVERVLECDASECPHYPQARLGHADAHPAPEDERAAPERQGLQAPPVTSRHLRAPPVSGQSLLPHRCCRRHKLRVPRLRVQRLRAPHPLLAPRPLPAPAHAPFAFPRPRTRLTLRLPLRRAKRTPVSMPPSC